MDTPGEHERDLSSDEMSISDAESSRSEQTVQDEDQTLQNNDSATAWLMELMESHEGPSILMVYDQPDSRIPSTNCLPLWVQSASLKDEQLTKLDFDVQSALQRHRNSSGHRIETAVDISRLGRLVSEKNRVERVFVKRLSVNRVPVEVFQLIAKHLSRNDLKIMRLVSKDFDRKTASSFFDTVVMPFDSQVYGHLPTTERTYASRGSRKSCPYNFLRSFGSHIRRLGMTIETDQETLLESQKKNFQEVIAAYKGLQSEETAEDESLMMRLAFSKLKEVSHLALTLDGLLGWLTGPDLSIRARALCCSRRMFPGRSTIAGHMLQAQRNFWLAIEEAYTTVGTAEDMIFAKFYKVEDDRARHLLANEVKKRVELPMETFTGVKQNKTSRKTQHSSENPGQEHESGRRYRSSQGVIYTKSIYNDLYPKENFPLLPDNPTRAQIEWMVEGVWGQDAFLTSYMRAIMDNRTVFKNLRSFSLSRISSRHLQALCRRDFWTSMSHVENLEICVIPDWRGIGKEDGHVSLHDISPSNAARDFSHLLVTQISQLKSITNLTIGWAEGGEHAEGLCARNKYLMPAPIGIDLWLDRNEYLDKMLFLPYVKHVALSNCWLTPNALVAFAIEQTRGSLNTLTLASVSITTHPKFSLKEYRVHQYVQDPLELFLASITGHARLGNCLQKPELSWAMHTGNIMELESIVTQQVLDDIAPLCAQIHGPVVMHQLRRLNPTHATIQTSITNAFSSKATDTYVYTRPFEPDPLDAARLAESGFGFKATYVADNLQIVHRVGSWGWVLMEIRRRLEEEDKTGLSINFLSCGHANLPNKLFHEHKSNTNPISERVQFFSERRLHRFDGITMTTRDKFLATIVGILPEMEMRVLESQWGLIRGWPTLEILKRANVEYDDDDGWGKWSNSSRTAACYDCHSPGGSGRFSGHVLMN